MLHWAFPSLFFNSLSSNFFTPYILQPTRLQAKTLIDNIFFNSLEYQSNSGNLLIEISDHLIQFLIIEGFVKERTFPEINLFKRDLSNFSEGHVQKKRQVLGGSVTFGTSVTKLASVG